MMEQQNSSSDLGAYVQIHVAVLLFGLTALLGDLILLPETGIVWWRMGMTSLSFLFIPSLYRELKKISWQQYKWLIAIGFIVALHWAFFFGAVKLSNVSITLSIMATATFFTSFIEPVLTKKKFSWLETAIGLAVIPGVYLIYRTDEANLPGIVVALISALLAALFGVLNKEQVDNHDPMAVTFVELGAGFVLFSPLVLVYYLWYEPGAPFLPTWSDLGYLSILAFLCTSLGFWLTLKALQKLDAFRISLTINLEPVYGIILAWVILHENKELDWNFYVGASVILVSVFIHPLIVRWQKRRRAADRPNGQA